MRFLIILLFILTACEQAPILDRQYTGHQKRWEECHSLWNLGWNIKVNECEKFMEGPKYKKGQKVRHLKQFDKNCYALVWRKAWGVENNPFIVADVYCGKQIHEGIEVDVQ